MGKVSIYITAILVMLLSVIQNSLQGAINKMSICRKTPDCDQYEYCDELIASCEPCGRLCKIPDLTNQCLVICPEYVLKIVPEMATSSNSLLHEQKEQCNQYYIIMIALAVTLAVLFILAVTSVIYCVCKRWKTKSLTVPFSAPTETGLTCFECKRCKQKAHHGKDETSTTTEPLQEERRPMQPTADQPEDES